MPAPSSFSGQGAETGPTGEPSVNRRFSLKRLLHAPASLLHRLASNGPQPSTADVQRDYINAALKKILAGQTHASLGANISEESRLDAYNSFAYLQEQGIQPSDVVVDFGCGTLRIGRHFIDYLDPGHFVGMDLDQRLLDLGLELLDPQTRSSKHPLLLTINPATLAQASATNPSVVFARGVLQHVPPDNLLEFFRNLATVGREALIIVAIKASTESRRLSRRSWIYSQEDILTTSGDAGLELVRRDDIWHHFRVSASSHQAGA